MRPACRDRQRGQCPATARRHLAATMVTATAMGVRPGTSLFLLPHLPQCPQWAKANGKLPAEEWSFQALVPCRAEWSGENGYMKQAHQVTPVPVPSWGDSASAVPFIPHGNICPAAANSFKQATARKMGSGWPKGADT